MITLWTVYNLNEDSPVDHGDGGGDEHVGVGNHVGIHQEDQGEGHGAPQAPVHHHKLVDGPQLLEPVVVGQGRQDQHPQAPAHKDDNNATMLRVNTVQLNSVLCIKSILNRIRII